MTVTKQNDFSEPSALSGPTVQKSMSSVLSRPLAAALLALALGLSALACSSSENQAAKERIFSPEEPPAHVLLAKEPLNPAKAASDSDLWERIVGMSRLEALERLGPHRAKAELSFEWQRGKRKLALAEEYRFAIDATGDFHAAITNDQDFGLEFIWSNFSAYAKSRYGAFRPRRIDRGQQDRWREEGSGSLAAILPLLDGGLGLKEASSGNHEGRKALRFPLQMLDKPAPAKSPANHNPLPPPIFGGYRAEGDSELSQGPDPDTARRLAFAKDKELRSLKGEVLIDQESGVILAAKVDADFDVPSEGEAELAQLQVKLNWTLIPDASLQVLPPENALPSKTMHAVDNPLWFLEGEPGFEVPVDEAPAGE